MNSLEIENLLRQAADEELQTRFTRVSARMKADGSLITEADTAMQSRILAELRSRWPSIPVVGEEMEPRRQQAIVDSQDSFWCLDPLDGTTNYSAGLPYYAVSLSLVRQARAVAGWVYDPQRRECFRAELGKGTMLNGSPLTTPPGPDELSECVALVDLKGLPYELGVRLMRTPPYRSQRSFGAVALDWCWVAAGRCHVYLHGRQNIWDYSAGSLVLAEAGGAVCLTDTAGGDCEPELFLGTRTGIGAVSHVLLDIWRRWIDAGQGY